MLLTGLEGGFKPRQMAITGLGLHWEDNIKYLSVSYKECPVGMQDNVQGHTGTGYILCSNKFQEAPQVWKLIGYAK
eukprot:9107453-Ditylum_brightwellii.AAC.1